MVQRVPVVTATLYEVDETAWLEATADLIRSGRLSEVELNTLAEYLTDMAKRDRREVCSRLVVLLAHLLKWEYQPDHRSGPWRGTIPEQQRELRQLLESGVLRNHATAVFADAYADARKSVVVETFVIATSQSHMACLPLRILKLSDMGAALRGGPAPGSNHFCHTPYGDAMAKYHYTPHKVTPRRRPSFWPDRFWRPPGGLASSNCD